MPNADKKQQAEDRIKFLADRMALLIVDLVCRDADYGEFCFDEFYTGSNADTMRESQHYKVALDFVREMIRRHDNGMGTDRRSSQTSEG